MKSNISIILIVVLLGCLYLNCIEASTETKVIQNISTEETENTDELHQGLETTEKEDNGLPIIAKLALGGGIFLVVLGGGIGAGILINYKIWGSQSDKAIKKFKKSKLDGVMLYNRKDILDREFRKFATSTNETIPDMHLMIVPWGSDEKSDIEKNKEEIIDYVKRICPKHGYKESKNGNGNGKESGKTEEDEKNGTIISQSSTETDKNKGDLTPVKSEEDKHKDHKCQCDDVMKKLDLDSAEVKKDLNKFKKVALVQFYGAVKDNDKDDDGRIKISKPEFESLLRLDKNIKKELKYFDSKYHPHIAPRLKRNYQATKGAEILKDYFK